MTNSDQRLIDYGAEYCGSFPELESWFPYHGKCGICGGPDARHRLWDSLVDMNNAGDSVEYLAAAYQLPVEAVQAVIQIKPYWAEMEFHNYGIDEDGEDTQDKDAN